MKLSISNIAWGKEQDEAVYRMMREHGFSGLEIAPTRIFEENPYDRLAEAAMWSRQLGEREGFCISSMQSIWFGRGEKLFGSRQEREALFDYTKRAIDFAAAVHCGNLVFGCPKNRAVPEGGSSAPAADFFRELGEYAYERHTVLAMEANPPVYQTNYINTTAQALELVSRVDSKGFMVNLDVGTMLENGETACMLRGKTGYISHVHISEPGLRAVEQRALHEELAAVLRGEGYQGFVSVEMAKQERIETIGQVMAYVRRVFG